MKTPIKKLDLKRETVRSLNVKSSVRTGDADTKAGYSSGYGGGRPGNSRGETSEGNIIGGIVGHGAIDFGKTATAGFGAVGNLPRP